MKQHNVGGGALRRKQWGAQRESEQNCHCEFSLRTHQSERDRHRDFAAANIHGNNG